MFSELLGCFQPSAITRSVLGCLCGVHKVKSIHFPAPPEIYTVLESTHEHHTCVHAVLASSQALWGKTGAKLLQHHFFIFLAVTQSIMSDRNKKREGSSFGLMFTREFQFFVVQKARLGTLSSVHIMVGQEPS